MGYANQFIQPTHFKQAIKYIAKIRLTRKIVQNQRGATLDIAQLIAILFSITYC